MLVRHDWLRESTVQLSAAVAAAGVIKTVLAAKEQIVMSQKCLDQAAHDLKANDDYGSRSICLGVRSSN